jgi:hypothetical protein
LERTLADDMVGQDPRLRAAEPVLRELFEAARQVPVAPYEPAVVGHGDYHDYQVLVAPGAQRLITVDYNPEPWAPPEEQRAHSTAFRDIAKGVASKEFIDVDFEKDQRVSRFAPKLMEEMFKQFLVETMGTGLYENPPSKAAFDSPAVQAYVGHVKTLFLAEYARATLVDFINRFPQKARLHNEIPLERLNEITQLASPSPSIEDWISQAIQAALQTHWTEGPRHERLPIPSPRPASTEQDWL